MNIAKTSSIGRMLGFALVSAAAIALALPGAAWAQKGGKGDPGKGGGYGSSSQGGGSSGPCLPGDYGCMAPRTGPIVVRLALASATGGATGGWVEITYSARPTAAIESGGHRKTISGSAIIDLANGGLLLVQHGTGGGVWTPPDTEREAAAREAAARYIVFFAIGTPGRAFTRLATGPDALVFQDPGYSVLVVHPANVPRLAMTQIRDHGDVDWAAVRRAGRLLPARPASPFNDL